MKPTPYEAREALLLTVARALYFEMSDSAPTDARRDYHRKLAAALDAVEGVRADEAKRVEPGPDRVPVTYTPNGETPHAPRCAVLTSACDAECDCGAWHEDAERKARGNAILSAISSSLPDNNPRGVERFLLTLHQQGFEVIRRDYANGAKQTAAKLGEIDEAVPLEFDDSKPTLERVKMLAASHAKVTDAVRWVMGEHPDGWPEAPPAEPGRIVGKFWWRRELRARAFG